MYQLTVGIMVRMTGLEPARRRQRNLNPPSLPIPPHPHFIKLFCYRPVAVPDSFLADKAATSSVDRGHSLSSLDSATGGGRIAPLLGCPMGDFGLCRYVVVAGILAFEM